MVEKEEEKYPLMVSNLTMRYMVEMLDWVHDQIPRGFMPESVWGLKYELNEIIRDGCFEHGILRKRYKTDAMSTELWCPLCSPKESAEAKEKAEKWAKFQRGHGL